MTLDPLNAIAVAARTRWLNQALKHQLPPQDNEWYIWLLLCGRGAGKTRCASEFIFWECWRQPRLRALVLAPTTADLRGTNFEGESGLLEVIPRELVRSYNRSTFEITLHNESIIRGIGAEAYQRLRGPQWHLSHTDEACAAQYPQQAHDLMMLGLRLPRPDGVPPRAIITSTPKPLGLLFDLFERSIDGDGDDHTIRITQASTYANLQNLAVTFQQQILQYEGSDYGRQEIYGELLDPSESSIFKRSQFRLWPADKQLPKFEFVLCSIDTATSTKDYADRTAAVVFGVFQPNEDSSLAVFIIDTWHAKVEYPDLRDRVIEMSKEIYGDPDDSFGGKRVDLILVESASSGISLHQELSRTKIPIVGRPPGAIDKLQRAVLVSPIVAAGKVWLPESTLTPGKPRNWAQEAMKEWTSYPFGVVPADRDEPYDDYIDAFTQGLAYLRDAGFIKVDFFAAQQRFADDDVKKVNPYMQ